MNGIRIAWTLWPIARLRSQEFNKLDESVSWRRMLGVCCRILSEAGNMIEKAREDLMQEYGLQTVLAERMGLQSPAAGVIL